MTAKVTPHYSPPVRLRILDRSPIVKVLLTTLRNKQTNSQQFNSALISLSTYMAYSFVDDFIKPSTVMIETPLAACEGHDFAGQTVALVPVLRAGNAMEQGFRQVLESVGLNTFTFHLGFRRNHETLIPEPYYRTETVKVPDVIVVLDPMLATGGTAVESFSAVQKRWGKGANRLYIYAGILGCPEGIENLQTSCPDVHIILAERDPELSDIGYIVPGLGDAGDRQFGT